jgi:membrane protein
MTNPTASAGRSRSVMRPRDLSHIGWGEVLKQMKERFTNDHLVIVAAGVAFFGLLALFPLIAATISIAGLIIDPQTIANEFSRYASSLPQGAADILKGQAKSVASSGGAAGLVAVASLAVTLYSASSGTKNLMEGMNIAFSIEEGRGFLKKNVVGLLLTLMLSFIAILGVIIIAVIPPLLGAIGLGDTLGTVLSVLRWPLLALLAILAFAALYRFGPNREGAEWEWITPGAVAGTALWLVGSALFSLYVANFGSYNETYGSIAGVIILMLWLWLSALCILLGAEMNAAISQQSEDRASTGPRRAAGP